MLHANPGNGPRTGIDRAPSAVWIDLLNPTEAERRAAEQAAGFAIQGQEDIAEIESSSRVSRKGDIFYLNSPVSFRDADGLSSVAPVGFALSPTRLVTVRSADMVAFDSFADQLGRGDAAAPSSAAVFAGLLEALVDHLADVLEHVGGELDRLSRQSFRRGGGTPRNSGRVTRDLRAMLSRLGLCGTTIDNARDTLLGLARIVGSVQQAGPAWAAEDIRQRLVILRQDIASLNDYDQQLTTKTGFLLDALMGFINIEQNEVVRVLTIASVVGIPPTFVVGLYGMNFKTMPEYDWAWGYGWGWAMIVVSVVVPLVWLRVKGWL
jgi:magnesium transporter